MEIQIRGGDCLNYRGDVLLLFHHSDVRPLTGSLALLDWRSNAAVSLLWKKKKELLRFGQLTIIATQGKIPTETVILTGLGPSDEFSADLRREGYRLALEAALKIGAVAMAEDGVPLKKGFDKGVLADLQSALSRTGGAETATVALFVQDKEQVPALRDSAYGASMVG
ncbi:MAG: hypothetical protein JSV00_01450 [bacterium]|nr:MAG: hypothetical protein JSV00_01450 [bacterium]